MKEPTYFGFVKCLSRLVLKNVHRARVDELANLLLLRNSNHVGCAPEVDFLEDGCLSRYYPLLGKTLRLSLNEENS